VTAVALVTVALAAVAVWVRRRLLVVTVDGASMEPALRGGDRVIVRRLRPGEAPARGRIVVISEPGPCRPADPSGRRGASLIVKRVSAVPGDPEPAYLPAWSRGPAGVVAAGHVVVLGDNAAVSRDSRRTGPVPARRVVGVVLRRISR